MGREGGESGQASQRPKPVRPRIAQDFQRSRSVEKRFKMTKARSVLRGCRHLTWGQIAALVHKSALPGLLELGFSGSDWLTTKLEA